MSDHDLLVERYEVREVLGCGGMAEVHDGWDTRLNRAVAIKLLHPSLRSQPDVRARFKDEARSAARLTHPHVVAVHDFGDDDGTPFIVMERLPGDTLADVMACGPMRPGQVRAMLDEVLSALTVAHGAGVLHRDIKPSNILLSSSGDSLKVADFGIAKTGGAAHTLTGQLVGTIAYMSPERIRGAPASMADDLYAVGVMAYEALMGHPVFPHDNPVTLARAILDDTPPSLQAVGMFGDPHLAAIVDRAMAPDPAERFSSAARMRTALADDRTELLVSAPAPEIPPTAVFPAHPSRRPRRGRTRPVLAAAGVLALFVVAVLALAMDPFSTPPPPPLEPAGASTTVPPPTTPPSIPVVTPVFQHPVEPPPLIPQVVPAEQEPGPKKPVDNGGGNGIGKGGGNGNGNGNGNGHKGNGNGKG